jgi:flagellar hook-basal body complex protein FliE
LPEWFTPQADTPNQDSFMTVNMLVSMQAELSQIKTQLDTLQTTSPILPAQASGESAQGDSFLHAMMDAAHGVDGQEQQARQRVEAVESGQSDDLVGAMVASQEASLSFSMLMQVRNKVMGAVDEIIKLPL